MNWNSWYRDFSLCGTETHSVHLRILRISYDELLSQWFYIRNAFRLIAVHRVSASCWSPVFYLPPRKIAILVNSLGGLIYNTAFHIWTRRESVLCDHKSGSTRVAIVRFVAVGLGKHTLSPLIWFNLGVEHFPYFFNRPFVLLCFSTIYFFFVDDIGDESVVVSFVGTHIFSVRLVWTNFCLCSGIRYSFHSNNKFYGG
jgi:hypothetical protein